jgi:hypothetical protein
VGSIREVFLRRYATSPIHVPRLERLLDAFDDGDDSFAGRFIAWDRECPDVEAARIVAEILSAGDAAGRIARLSDEAVQQAIRWMSDRSALTVAERADALRAALASSGAEERLAAMARLEANRR